MKKNISILFLLQALIVLTFSCSDDDKKDVVELVLEKSKVSLTPTQSVNINIESGNGDYTVISSDKTVANAKINGNIITISSETKEERANAVIVVTDKMYKRTTIDVTVAQTLDLLLDTKSVNLEVGVSGRNETIVTILSGNFGYKTEILEGGGSIVEVDNSEIETSEKFRIKALAEGTVQIKVSDYLGNEATVSVTVTNPQKITIDKSNIKLNTIQASDTITISSGNGAYTTNVANPLIAKASINGNTVIVTGKRKGTTNITIEDEKGQTSQVEITVDGAEYAMNLSDQFFGYANFKDITQIDKSITECKQITFELTCKIGEYRGLQTFMGLEGKLIMRGKYDDYKETHPIEIAGLGDRIMLESTNDFKLDEWMNLALTVDCDAKSVEEKYKLYINGVRETLIVKKQDETHSVVNLASCSDGDRFQIGRACGQEWRAMRGMVSEARVWTIARTEQQIKTNMCTLVEENPTGLLARWDFSAGAETNYIQDTNGGKYETNLILSRANIGGYYTPTTVPLDVFVSKGCPK